MDVCVCIVFDERKPLWMSGFVFSKVVGRWGGGSDLMCWGWEGRRAEWTGAETGEGAGYLIINRTHFPNPLQSSVGTVVHCLRMVCVWMFV